MAGKIAQYLQSTGKYLSDAGDLNKISKIANDVDMPTSISALGIMSKGATAIPKIAGTMAADATIKLAKGYNKVMPMTKKTTPGAANLWTGRREGRGAIAGAVAIGGAYGWGNYTLNTEMAPKLGTVSYGGTAPVMNADGVGTTPQAPLSNAPTLGAGGQMVFGLHNARKG
jgi:hypothetical protein